MTNNGYDPAQEKIISAFYSDNHTNLNSLKLITSDSKAAYKKFISGRLNEIHNVEVVPIPTHLHKENTSC